MKNCIIVLFALLVLTTSLSAQTASITRIQYQKGDKPAALITVPYSPEIVEGALKNRISKVGVKEERLKGMLVYKGGRLTPTDGEVVDFYFRIDRKGKKDDNTSDVYLILGRPNENVALRTEQDNYRVNDAKQFLESLTPDLEAFKLESDIAAQEEQIRKSEKTLKGLLDDQSSYESRIRELQDKLNQNKIDQNALQAELNKQRTLRDALLSKRVTGKS